MGNGLMHLCLIEHTDFKRPEITPQNYNNVGENYCQFSHFP